MTTTATTTATTKAHAAPHRERPIPASMQPSEAGLAEANAIAARITNALMSAIDRIDDLEHPIERAIGATTLIDALTDLASELKEVRQNAVKDAYEQGRSESGWYGYSAIAGQIGLSPSRVRQILFDIITNPDGTQKIRDDEVGDIRALADARRDAIKMLKAGGDRREIATATGLPPAEIHKIARAIHAS